MNFTPKGEQNQVFRRSADPYGYTQTEISAKRSVLLQDIHLCPFGRSDQKWQLTGVEPTSLSRAKRKQKKTESDCESMYICKQRRTST